jgi:hypothetical protein
MERSSHHAGDARSDAAFVFKAIQEAGRPAYETLSPTEARAIICRRA